MNTCVYESIEENERWIREKCKDCSDIIIRPLRMGEKGRISGLAVYIEITVSNLMLDESMLGRMIIKLSGMPDEEIAACIRKNELGISDMAPLHTLEDGLAAMMAGNLILFIEGYEGILKIGSRGYPFRSVSAAESEKVLKGSNEGFGESVKVNAALIRKRIRSTGLKVVDYFMGQRSDTLVQILYMEELVRKPVLRLVKERLEKYMIDGVLDSGVIEQLGEDVWYSPFPQFQTTERPDLAAMELLNGRVVILCDNSPMALLLPTSLHSMMCVSEDRNNRFMIASFQRILRYGAFFLGMLFSGLYLAVITFHTNILPTNLVLSFAEARKGVPFPCLLEILLMELAFELIREAGLRMPGPLSGTIGIVGGLIIGDAAVSANLVSPMSVVVVAVSALSSFAIPGEELAGAVRLVKYGFIFLGGMLGMFGITAGIYALAGHLAFLTSFRIPYLIPFTEKGIPGYDSREGILRKPMKKMKDRPVFAKLCQKVRLKERNI